MSADPQSRFADELALLLQVPYPLIFIRALEEAPLRALLEHITTSLDLPLHTWSITQGLHLAHAQTPVPCDLQGLFAHLGQEPPRGLLLLLEPEPFLDNPLVVRRLREHAETHPHIPLVLVGPQLQIPTALTREATLIHAPLPGRTVLRALLDHALPLDTFRLLPRERLVGAALGLTRAEAGRAFLRARLAHHLAGSPPVFPWETQVIAEKKRAIAQDDVVEFIEPEIGLDAVGGLDDLKDWLDTRKAAFSQEARDFGLPSPKGLLLVGVQGCGKSLVAKAVARHWGLPLLRLDLGAIFAGRRPPDAALSRALTAAEALAPCVLWTDEIEKGFGTGMDSGASRILGSLLTWLQEKQSEVFFVATANEVESLPPELLRKGRFDEMFFVDLPGPGARHQILEIHLRKHQRDPDTFDLDTLVDKTEHFSGAELEELVAAALYEAFAEARALHDDDLITLAEQLVPLYTTREDDIKALREWARSRARFAAKDTRVLDFFAP